MIALRLYLGLVSGAGLFLAFWAWLKLRPGLAVPIAAGLFASLWMSMFYGPMLMPNVLTAEAAVAGVGLFLQGTRLRGAWPQGAGIGAAFAVMSLLRPTEALPVAALLLVAAAVWRPWRRILPVAAVAAGTFVGWTAWTIEAYLRFGGLAARLAEASSINEAGGQFTLLRHLESFGSGTVSCHGITAVCGRVTPAAVLIWSAIPLLVGTGLWAARRTPHQAGLILTVVVGGCSAFPYLFYTGLADPRYLLGSYALLSLGAAEGIVWVIARHRHVRTAMAMTLVLFTAHQFILAAALGHGSEKGRAHQLHMVRALTGLGIRPPCLITGEKSWQIAVAAHCLSLGDHILVKADLQQRTREVLSHQAGLGTHVAAISTSATDAQVPLGWQPHQVLHNPARYAYLPPSNRGALQQRRPLQHP